MTVLVDTSVLIGYLRGNVEAAAVLERERTAAPLHDSDITRLEVLAGVRPPEADATQALLSTFVWHPVDTDIAERAGALGRTWLPSHHTIDGADLAIAATATRLDARLLTRNVRHVPMLPGPRAVLNRPRPDSPDRADHADIAIGTRGGDRYEPFGCCDTDQPTVPGDAAEDGGHHRCAQAQHTCADQVDRRRMLLLRCGSD